MSAGSVGRPHGLDGSFYVTGALPRLLSVGVSVRIAGHPTVVVRRAGTDKRPIVRVEGISDRPAAEAARGAQLMVDEVDAPALQEGEWWAGQLEGCSVFDGARLVGVVTRLMELPSCEVLEVAPGPSASGESRSPRTLLIPMVRDAIRSVDVEERRIDVDMSFVGEEP